MINDSDYKLLCEQFDRLIALSPNEQQIELEKIAATNESIAKRLTAMLEADQHFDEDKLFGNEPADMVTKAFAGAGSVNDTPKKLGNYEIRSQLGGGGMGLVFKAFDPMANREVALKIIRPDLVHDDDVRTRMLNEAQAAAKLSHPNIISVLDVAMEDGNVYFTMPLINVGDLKSSMTTFQKDDSRIASLFVKLARALGHAHEMGLIHRDFKPSNIIIDNNGEPLLVDFGLVKDLIGQQGQTETGQLMGSVNYMSPEQIKSSKDVGPATDIYSFGATLYECLVGQPPFSGNDLIQLFYQIKTIKPPKPSDLNPKVNRKLEMICMKCLEKDPSRRYTSMQEVEAELNRVIEGKPLSEKSNFWKGLANVANSRMGNLEQPRTATVAAFVFTHTLTFHLAIWLCLMFNASTTVFWAVYLIAVGSLAVVNWIFHWSIYWHLEVTERQSAISLLLVTFSLISLLLIFGPLTLDGNVNDFLKAYPSYSLIFATTLGAHGSVHAGKWLIYSLPFFPIAVIIPYFGIHGPLFFAVASSLATFAIVRDVYGTKSTSDSDAPVIS